MKTRLKLIAVVSLMPVLIGCAQTEQADLTEIEHIHNVTTDGEGVYVGSHNGLYKFSESWELVGDPFDVMGFTINGSQFLASGHPGPEMNLPDPLGLIVSNDQGEDWNSLGLTGDVDFHFLRASGQTIIGVASNYGRLVSSQDGGQSWQAIEFGEINDISINPTNPDQVVVSSENDLYLTNPLIEDLSLVETGIDVKRVVWFERGLVILSGNTIYISDSLESPFEKLKKVFSSPVDIAAAENQIVVRDSQGIHLSQDLGQTFELIYSENGAETDESDHHED